MAQMLALGFDCWVEKPCYRRKTPLVVWGTQTQALADSIAIAASASVLLFDKQFSARKDIGLESIFV